MLMAPMDRFIRKNLVATTLAGAAVIVLAAGAAVMQQAQQNWVRHSYDVLRHESRLRVALSRRDATTLRYAYGAPRPNEGGKRVPPYSDLADQNYLEAEQERTALLDLVADNPSQTQRLIELGAVFARLRAKMDEIWTLTDAHQPLVAQAALSTPSHHADRRRTQVILDQFEEAEQVLLDQREASHTRWAVSLWGGLVASMFIIALLLFRMKSALGIAAARAREHRKTLQRLAFYDESTGLPNRRYLEQQFAADAIDQTVAAGELAILQIYVANARDVSAIYGDAIGDRLIQTVIERLSARLGPEDSLARLADDRFAVIVQGVPIDGLIRPGSGLAYSLGLRVAIDDVVTTPVVEVGYARFPKDGDTFDALLAHSGARIQLRDTVIGHQHNHEGAVNFAPTRAWAIDDSDIEALVTGFAHGPRNLERK